MSHRNPKIDGKISTKAVSLKQTKRNTDHWNDFRNDISFYRDRFNGTTKKVKSRQNNSFERQIKI